MWFNKRNMFGIQNGMPPQTGFQQPPATQGQFGTGNFTPIPGRRIQGLPGTIGVQGGLRRSQNIGRGMGRPSSRLGGAMSRTPAYGGNLGLGAIPQNPGSQGYTTPSYSPQGLGQPQGAMGQTQGYLPQGYEGQLPVQATEPKGGIKAFFINLITKQK